MRKFSLLMLALLAVVGMRAQSFTIDLTAQSPVLPDGVHQVTHPGHGASYNDAQHGWCWFAFKFYAEGPVTITLGSCQYAAANSAYVTDGNGETLMTLDTRLAECYHQNPDANVVTYTYQGGADSLTVYCGQYCPMAKVEPYVAPTEKEKKLYFTNFQNWTAVAKTEENVQNTVNTPNGDITFTFSFTEVNPTGTNAKFTNTQVITSGYMMADKTPLAFIQTSAIANVTKVCYVHAATGSNRGWGLLARDAGTTEWDTLYTTPCAQAGTYVEVDVNRQNVELRWFNLNGAQNAYMTEVAIYGMVAVQPRTFVDFDIDMTQETLAIPEDVTQVSYAQHGAQYNGASHGWMWAAFRFAVDGPVRITLGGCEYATANSAYVCGTQDLNADGVVNESDTYSYIDITTPGCYHNGGTASWTYNVEAPDTLTVYCGQYCPYIKVEACEFVEDITIIYFDQNKERLGEESVAPGLPFNPPYSLDSVPAGKAFRGWYRDNGTKIAEGEIINADLSAYMLVTDIEEATVGSHYKYDLTKNSFYMEDHELISGTGKQHGSGHGFVFQNGEEMQLIVSPKSYVSVGLCTYTKTSDQLIYNAAGDSVGVMHVIRDGEEGATPDGTLASFYYENAQGQPDTLRFAFTTESYIHSVEVYNVAQQLDKQGHCYRISGGDAATLMMVASILQDYDTVYLENGVYDLGETVLTTIGANHVAIIGESMDSTIIYNAPDVRQESINNTATILNAGNYNTYENLTLQNGLDYYYANNGRAVTLHDKGSYTACYNVRLLSYQDTYYSNMPGQKCWFEDCEIHGTVDYICGSGSVYFYNTLLYCEARQSQGGGSDCITASNAQTAQGDKGYVFDRCTIQSACPTVSLSRAWNDQPQVAYLLTTLDMSAGQFSLVETGKIERWTIAGMNKCDPYLFGEYNSMDTEGNVISPASNVVKFTSANNPEMETILNYEQAVQLSYPNFFTDWQPARNYVDFPAPAEDTALDQVGADNSVKKYMLNGQMVIEKNGVIYNALGQMVK